MMNRYKFYTTQYCNCVLLIVYRKKKKRNEKSKRFHSSITIKNKYLARVAKHLIKFNTYKLLKD